MSEDEEDKPLVAFVKDDVRDLWQFGSLICFFTTFDFSKLFPSSFNFCARKLLDSLTGKGEQPYLTDLLVCLLQLYSSNVTYQNWGHFYLEVLASELEPDDRRLVKEFDELTPTQRLRALYDLCHMILSLSEPLREQIESKEDTHEAETEPFGCDNDGSKYWLFSKAGALTFLKEIEPTFEVKNGKTVRTLTSGSWNVIATNAAELAVFATTIAEAASAVKKKDKPAPLTNLYNRLVNEALPECELQENLARRRKRRETSAGLDRSLILDDTVARSARTKRVCYKEVDVADDDGWD